MQCGFYRRGYRALKGGKPPAFRFIVQETTPPYSVGQFAFDGAGLDYADYLAEQAVWKWGGVHQGSVLAQLCRWSQCDGGTVLGERETGGGIMGKPTPEPWTVDQDPMGALIISGPEGETVFYTGTMSEDCANAELIVDARKTAAERNSLLDALQNILEIIDSGELYDVPPGEDPPFARMKPDIQPIDRAIAKAEGRD